MGQNTSSLPGAHLDASGYVGRAAEILESIQDGFFALGRDWRFTYLNKRAAAIVGLLPEQLIGKNIWELYPQLLGTELERAYRDAMHDRVPTQFEHVGLYTRLWCEIRVFPSSDGGISVYWLDRTKRKQAEEDLQRAVGVLEDLVQERTASLQRSNDELRREIERRRQSEERLRALATAGAEVVFRLSPDWGSVCELSGHDLCGATDGSITGWFDTYIHPSDQALISAAIKECIRDKKPIELEHRVLRKDGSVGWRRSKAVPLMDDNGDIKEWFGSSSDITERERAQEELHDTAARLAQARDLLSGIIEGTADIIAAIDTDFSYLAMNEAYRRECKAIYGADVHVGGSLIEMLAPYPEDEKNAREVFEQAFRGNSVVVTQSYGDPKRSRRIYERHINPIRDAKDRIVGAAHITREVTERRRMEEALREADQQKNRFLATLSHELRNPLAAIRTCTDILGRVPPGGEQANRALATINRQCEQLAHLVDDLLDVSRITQNKIVLQPERLELNDLLREVLGDFEVIFEASGLRLQSMLDPSPIFLTADRTRLAQVFDNLLHNAAKFTPRGGLVTVSTCLDADVETAIVRVADTGIGIEPEMIPRLFKPFAQLDTSLDRHGGGLGLGLALIKRLVELHGGEVGVVSAGAGWGTEFTIKLPWKEQQVQEARTVTAPQHRCRSVLIIEDNVDVAESLRELLELAGHEVEVANSGHEGLALASAKPPEVLLCDIGMPGMDGFAVGRAFRSDVRLKDVFLVALTGYTQPDDVEKVKAAGFDRHLAKPVDLATLRRVLAAED